MAMHTNDQTADAVHDHNGTEGQTTTDGPGGIEKPSSSVGAVPGAASTHPLPNGIVLESLTDRAIVRIEVDGEIGPDYFLGDSDAMYADDVAISRIDGTGERDSFRFSGTMVDLEIVEGDVEVALDLHRDDPADQGHPTRLSIHAQGSEVDYGFTVSGAVEPGHEAAPAGGDGERNDVATGTVTGSGVDEYAFTGEITEFETSSDDVLILVNDRVVDPDDLD